LNPHNRYLVGDEYAGNLCSIRRNPKISRDVDRDPFTTNPPGLRCTSLAAQSTLSPPPGKRLRGLVR
jgi:hypothetical protein